jgi:hypothetical protein
MFGKLNKTIYLSGNKTSNYSINDDVTIMTKNNHLIFNGVIDAISLSGSVTELVLVDSLGQDLTESFIINKTTSLGIDGHVCISLGYETVANGLYSYAEGYGTISNGYYSHAGGNNSIASGNTSFIHSTNSIAIGDRSVVLGGQNITGTTSDTVYIPNLNISYSGTPSSSADPLGEIGAIRWDDTYFYWKTINGWLRVSGSTF